MSGAQIASGTTPICASNPLRRGLPEPKINKGLLKAVVDPTFGQIIWGHLDLHLVACQNSDAVFAHLACRVRDDFMAILKFDPKRRIRQEFLHDTGEFENIFLGHVVSIIILTTHMWTAP